MIDSTTQNLSPSVPHTTHCEKIISKKATHTKMMCGNEKEHNIRHKKREERERESHICHVESIPKQSSRSLG
jgi:hypothetical protein